MWDKMIYTLCRCPFDRFIKSTCHVFTILTAFQFLHKTFFDQFILRKLDFKKLMEEIVERLNGVFSEVHGYIVNSDQSFETTKAKVTDQLRSKFLLQEPALYLAKLEVHLMRLFNPEFLQINVNQVYESSANEGSQIFMRDYFRSLFLIGMLKATLNYDQTKNAATNLKSVTSLLSFVDKVSQDNFEFFIRPYYKLAQFAFPSLLFYFCRDIENCKNSDMYSPQNELTCFIYACLNLFFNIKFDLEELNE